MIIYYQSKKYLQAFNSLSFDIEEKNKAHEKKEPYFHYLMRRLTPKTIIYNPIHQIHEILFKITTIKPSVKCQQ